MTMRKVVDDPKPFKTAQEEPVNDLKAVGTIVTESTTGNIHSGRKSCKLPRIPCSRQHMYRPDLCLPINIYMTERRLGESTVVRWKQNQTLWQQLDLACLEEQKCCVSLQVNSLSTEDGYHDKTQNILPRQQEFLKKNNIKVLVFRPQSETASASVERDETSSCQVAAK